jgi:hypothetical protein
VEQKRKEAEKKTCLQCGRKHITPGTPEEEYRQMDICRNQEWIDYITEQQEFLDNWL